MTVPVRQIYGAEDPASPPEQAERTAAELGGPNELVVFEEGVHVSNNVPYRSRTLAADWLAERLRAVRSAPSSLGSMPRISAAIMLGRQHSLATLGVGERPSA